jgi:hypothetical protein
MAVDFKIDTVPWENAVRGLRALSSKTTAALVNNSAGSVAIKCYKWTKRADRRKIKDDFKQAVYRQNVSAFTKTGKLRKNAKLFKKSYTFKPWVYGYIRKRFPGVSQDQLDTYAKNIYGKRLAAVGYIANGWRKAIMFFGKRFRPMEKFVLTHDYGLAQKATPGVVVEAMLGNDADYASEIAGTALQIALDQEAEELKFETKRRLQNLVTK